MLTLLSKSMIALPPTCWSRVVKEAVPFGSPVPRSLKLSRSTPSDAPHSGACDRTLSDSSIEDTKAAIAAVSWRLLWLPLLLLMFLLVFVAVEQLGVIGLALQCFLSTLTLAACYSCCCCWCWSYWCCRCLNLHIKRVFDVISWLFLEPGDHNVRSVYCIPSSKKDWPNNSQKMMIWPKSKTVIVWCLCSQVSMKLMACVGRGTTWDWTLAMEVVNKQAVVG